MLDASNSHFSTRSCQTQVKKGGEKQATKAIREKET
jgi:hypothetical protein